ncbi:allophanate hydrolase [Alloactinosynnema sp. L-07]|uniref:allophanate hydrolase n=1 Tax=Alloactinosynnema sp. L-07 TaxID=1653480 RepID=UPI0006B4C6FD|nr:allophanate hydrolase [Alloactinosynnema sp. L-07]
MIFDALEAARTTAQPAFITVFDDAQVRAFAEQAGDGPLAGIPFVVKDNIDVEGVPTTAGCPTRTTPAAGHAGVVRALLSAGAVPIAKSNLDQFATGLVGTRSPYGACHSVASAEHVSGGSSSGSAVAVASGIVPLALGTDTAGSGRVPAAFNGIVGMKPTRGLVSTAGVVPACPSLDCVTTFTRDVATARAAFDAVVRFDPGTPWSRPMPAAAPAGVARWLRVIAVPDSPLDLDEPHQVAWAAALAHAATIAHLVPVDITPFLDAARLLYSGPFVAERLAAFGGELDPDGPHLDPTVRRIVLGAESITGADVFAGLDQLERLRALACQVFVGADALLLPVTPGHPTLAEVAADPIGANSRLGTYTNMVNLLDLCAIAVPAGERPDGLPFGVQLIAPAFADRPLLDLGSRWTGEPCAEPDAAQGHTRLAVVGAHLTGQPANPQLVALGGRLHARARTAGGYRLYRVPGPFPRPGLIPGDGSADGVEVEIWELPNQGLGALLPTIAAPLGLGPVRIDDGTVVTGFVADATGVDTATNDITDHGGWRAYLRSAQR